MSVSIFAKRSKTALAIVVFFFVLFSFLTVEFLTRLIFPRPLEPILIYTNNVLTNFNAELDWSLNPGSIRQIRTTDDEIITYNINSYGFRGEEPGDTNVDVFFVGDSITFSTNANTSFPEEFSKTSNLSFVNGGVPGYGTDQSFLMTRLAIEKKGIRPRRVVYGFYYNDIQNNVFATSIHAEKPRIIHKPILDLETNLYHLANYKDNDITIELADRDIFYAFKNLLMKSKFLWAIGRVIKYDVIGHYNPSLIFEFNEVAKNYLERNLDNFINYLRNRDIEFILLHIPNGVRSELEQELEVFLSEYCKARKVLYVRPTLIPEDYLKTDVHLSSQGARTVAAALLEEIGQIPSR